MEANDDSHVAVSFASMAAFELFFAEVVEGFVNGGPLTVLLVALYAIVHLNCVPSL